jgi:small subunit ribosomal protein S4e
MGPKKVPYLITHDARTIRYPNPHIKANDTIQVDIATGKIQEHIKFDTGSFLMLHSLFFCIENFSHAGNIVMITGGHNLGRVGIIQSRERHPGSFDIVHVKDANGHTFATRYKFCFF